MIPVPRSRNTVGYLLYHPPRCRRALNLLNQSERVLCRSCLEMDAGKVNVNVVMPWVDPNPTMLHTIEVSPARRFQRSLLSCWVVEQNSRPQVKGSVHIHFAKSFFSRDCSKKSHRAVFQLSSPYLQPEKAPPSFYLCKRILPWRNIALEKKPNLI